ncbi:unnamed protein product [Prorocentrum cordatum]|uniref:Uncharacterized protein n=1 Tax=Prorocentrum cordatum TaxID=2364126 RepID=A0ABN9QX32_9DINO|nr:unnamed protein product [Polarella glacialis]
MADGARPLRGPLMGCGDLPHCSPSRSWLAAEVEAPESPPSYQPSEGTSADSTMAASVSEPSSTAIRVWADGLYKTVREDGLATPRPGQGISELSYAERAYPGKLPASEALEARRGAIRRRCGKTLLCAACLALLAWAARANAGGLRLERLLRLGAGPGQAEGEAEQPLMLCESGAAGRCAARELFESPEVYNVAAESLMQVGRQLLAQEDRQAVWAAVASGFRNVTVRLEDRAPQEDIGKSFGNKDPKASAKAGASDYCVAFRVPAQLATQVKGLSDDYDLWLIRMDQSVVMPFLQAVKDGNAEAVNKGIQGGIDAKTVDEDSIPALMIAANSGSLETCQVLLQAGADPNGAEPFNSKTPLMTAAQAGSTEIVELLLASGADPGMVDSEGTTALMWAAVANKAETAKLLEAKGGAEKTNNEGLTAAAIAQKMGHKIW